MQVSAIKVLWHHSIVWNLFGDKQTSKSHQTRQSIGRNLPPPLLPSAWGCESIRHRKHGNPALWHYESRSFQPHTTLQKPRFRSKNRLNVSPYLMTWLQTPTMPPNGQGGLICTWVFSRANSCMGRTDTWNLFWHVVKSILACRKNCKTILKVYQNVVNQRGPSWNKLLPDNSISVNMYLLSWDLEIMTFNGSWGMFCESERNLVPLMSGT